MWESTAASGAEEDVGAGGERNREAGGTFAGHLFYPRFPAVIETPVE